MRQSCNQFKQVIKPKAVRYLSKVQRKERLGSINQKFWKEVLCDYRKWKIRVIKVRFSTATDLISEVLKNSNTVMIFKIL